MFENILALVSSFIIGTISASGYFGVVVLMAIESACIPLPSEIIMPFAGYLVATGRFNLLLTATAGALGCNIGSTLAYAVGWHGGRPLVERWGRYILMSKKDLEHAERFFRRFGGLAVFFGRLLPVVRTFIARPAGVARMPMLRFQIYTFLGSWPWCLGLAYAGTVLGERWDSDPQLRRIFHNADIVIIALIAAAVAWSLRSRWKARTKRPG